MSTNELTTQSIKELLRFPFRGPQWQNRFLIGLALTLAGFIVPIAPAIFQMGYVARLMRKSIRGEALELPAWDDWGKMGLDGLRVFGVSLIYLLPSYVVMFGGMAVYFAGFFSIFPIVAMSDQTSEIAVAMPLLMFALMGIMFLSMFVGYLLMFLGVIPLPVAMARAVEQEKFTAGFQIKEITKLLWRNKSGYFIAWVILAGLFAIFYVGYMMLYLTLILAWAMFIVVIPFVFYLMLVSAALFGQTYRESVEASPEGKESPAEGGESLVQSMSLSQFRREFTPHSRDSSPSPQFPELMDWLLRRRFGMTWFRLPLCERLCRIGTTKSRSDGWPSVFSAVSSPARHLPRSCTKTRV